MPTDSVEVALSELEERPSVVAIEAAPSAEVAPPLPAGQDQVPTVEVRIPDRTIKNVLVGIFLLMVTGALFFAENFLLPVALAFLLALVLSPVVRALHKRGVPEAMTALGLVAILVITIGSGLYLLSGPVAQWIQDAPNIAGQVRTKIAAIRKPVEAIAHATDQVQQLAQGGQDDGAQKVVVSEPGLLSRAAAGLPDAIAKVTVTLILLLFLLASGDMFYQKTVAVLPTLSDKKRAVRILRDVERTVSRYLLTITSINASLGILVGIESWFVGLPTPMIWGVAAGFLNFIPYIGPFIGISLVAVVGIVAFDTLSQAALMPALYLGTAIIEGQIITPMVVGRRLELNEVAIFIALAFWGWVWGIVGALIAVPFLVVLKVFADEVESLHPLGQFLSARHVPSNE